MERVKYHVRRCSHKKRSLTFLFNASAILDSVFVEVTFTDPDSSPDIVVRQTPDFFANSSCDNPFASLISLTLYCKFLSLLSV